MKIARCARVALASVAAIVTCASQPDVSRTLAAQAMSVPVFEVETGWPQTMPYNWMFGLVPALATDSRDHVWVLHRPSIIAPENRARAAPAVVEFDPNGKFVNGWGGLGIPGFDWPDTEHGIHVDSKGNVWVGGSAPSGGSLRTLFDDMILKFDRTGKFLLQIGGRSTSKGNADTRNLHQSADMFVFAKTNEVFVADGYGNRRVVVFDADTGAFKRMWGAFGNVPIDVQPAPAGGGGGGGGGGNPAPKLDTTGDGSPQFGGPTHGIKVSNDGLVYVADRSNRRVQVFTPEGKYVTQMFLNRAGPSNGSAAAVAFSPDAAQRFLYVADYGNSHIAVVERKSMQVLYQFGQRSAKPGDFQGVHQLAVDSKGNIYTAEVNPGARIQKFAYKGMSSKLPPNALTAEQLSPAVKSQ